VKVYVLLHSEEEGGSTVRGVYTTQELADEALTVSEYAHSEGGSFEHGWWWKHSEYCCGVDEVEVLDHIELPYHGPENIDLNTVDRRGGWVVPDTFVHDMADIFASDMVRTYLVDNSKTFTYRPEDDQ